MGDTAGRGTLKLDSDVLAQLRKKAPKLDPGEALEKLVTRLHERILLLSPELYVPRNELKRLSNSLDYHLGKKPGFIGRILSRSPEPELDFWLRHLTLSHFGDRTRSADHPKLEAKGEPAQRFRDYSVELEKKFDRRLRKMLSVGMRSSPVTPERYHAMRRDPLFVSDVAFKICDHPKYGHTIYQGTPNAGLDSALKRICTHRLDLGRAL